MGPCPRTSPRVLTCHCRCSCAGWFQASRKRAHLGFGCQARDLRLRLPEAPFKREDENPEASIAASHSSQLPVRVHGACSQDKVLGALGWRAFEPPHDGCVQFVPGLVFRTGVNDLNRSMGLCKNTNHRLPLLLFVLNLGHSATCNLVSPVKPSAKTSRNP